jgi:hypothetical protein
VPDRNTIGVWATGPENEILRTTKRLGQTCQTHLKKGLLKISHVVLFAARSRLDVARRTGGILERSFTEVLTVSKSDVEWAAHPGRKVPGRSPKGGRATRIFDSVRR